MNERMMIFMSKSSYLSQDEINEIEKITLDPDIIEARKNNDILLFKKIQIKKDIYKIKKILCDDETICFYTTCKNYTIDSLRVSFATSAFFSRYGHPIYNWNTECIFLQTNKRFILVELTSGFQYSKHYEISNEIHLVAEENEFYLIVSGDNKKTIIKFNNNSYDLLMNNIQNAANIIIDKKLLPKNKFLLMSMTKLVVIFLIFNLIILILSWFSIIEI